MEKNDAFGTQKWTPESSVTVLTFSILRGALSQTIEYFGLPSKSRKDGCPKNVLLTKLHGVIYNMT
jgi:hypothetical protein